MKIRRFSAPDMRQAIRLVRDEQGPDAVILSSRRVEGGVELVTAVDYDESAFGDDETAAVLASAAAYESEVEAIHEPDLASVAELGPKPLPGADETPEPVKRRRKASPARRPASPRAKPDAPGSQDSALTAMQREIEHLRAMLEGQLANLAWNDLRHRQPGRAQIIRRLEGLGIDDSLARAVAADVSETEAGEPAWHEALERLAGRIRVAPATRLEGEGIIALVGPSGVGKTTTVAKLAARDVQRHGSHAVALVTTDAYRIGAYRQLQTFGQILGVPVYLAQTGRELGEVLMGLGEKRRVFVDTAGMSQRDLRLAEEMAGLAALPSLRTLLVVAATTQQQVLQETFRSFEHLGLAGTVVTKLDEAASLGPVLSALCAGDLPLMFVSDGQRVPEDLQPAHAAGLVHRAVTLASESAEERLPNNLRVLHKRGSDNHVSA
jgi:flagellar biosynthesis protein FlhF